MGFLKSRLFRFIASLGLAALFYFLCPPCFNKTYLGAVLLLLVLIINLNSFFGRFRWLTHIVRFSVGALFIFSGFIKANDPIGFGIKLDEYFEVFEQGFSCDMHIQGKAEAGIPCAKDEKQATEIIKTSAPDKSSFSYKMWEFFREHVLFLAIFITGLEMALGLFLILGLQVRWTLVLLFGMIIFFAFLTFYSACCNKVTTCGCFGDAIKLTPWESFWKDLILLILLSIILVGEQNVQPLFKNRIILAGVAGIGLFASFAFPVYTYRHLPIIDFRPYAIGTNLWEASHAKSPAKTGCKNDSVYITYYYRNIASKKIMHFHDLDSMPDSTWEYYCRDDKMIRKGNCAATVLDFNLSNSETGEDYTDSLLQLKGIQFFLIMEDISKTDRSAMGKINLFYAACAKNKTVFNGLSNASMETVTAFRTETGAKYPMLTVDGTALKTVIRSNPGLVMLKNGIVVDMWHFNDFPDYKDVMEEFKTK